MFPREKILSQLAVIIRVHVRAVEYRAAAQAILDSGEAARPELEKLLNHRDLVVRHRAAELVDRIDRMGRDQ